MLCQRAGFVPKSAEQEYEQQWFYSFTEDMFKDPTIMVPIYNPEAIAEQNERFVNAFKECWTILDERYSDGRKYTTGDSVVFADFGFLTVISSIIENEGLRVPENGAKLKEILESLPNVKRAYDNLKELPGISDAFAAMKPGYF